MALKNLFDYNWWSKFFHREKAKPLLPNTLPTVEPLGPPIGKLFNIDFSYPTSLNEVTKHEEEESPILSGTSTHESVLIQENFDLYAEEEEYEWPQDNPKFIKNSFYRESWSIPQPHIKDAREKYGYDNPLVIKMVNMLDPKDFRIFVSPKQFCETLGVKPKKLYASLESESKVFNNKYKLEIISFPMAESKYKTI
jgi:hypothetical protein